MPYCPECGEEVRADDRFCPECGTELDGGERRHPDAAGPADATPTVSAADHTLLLGVTAFFALLALLESGFQLLYPDVILETFELEDVLSESVLSILGGFGVAWAVGVLALAAYYYRRGTLQKRFFWLLIAAGAVGFLVVGMITFVLLIPVGIYGLVSVMD